MRRAPRRLLHLSPLWLSRQRRSLELAFWRRVCAIAGRSRLRILGARVRRGRLIGAGDETRHRESTMHSDRVLILFGAGASSGSEPPGIFVPPLGAHLFGKLVDFSPGVWGALPDPYPLLFQKDFEEAFRKLGEDSPNPLSSAFNPTAPCPA